MWFLLPFFYAVKLMKSGNSGSVSSAPKTSANYPPAVKTTTMTPTQIEALAWAEFRRNAEANEGNKLVVYKDHLGFLTVGIGHKVVASDNLKLGDRISPAQVTSFFYKDGNAAFTAAKSQAKELGKYTPEMIAALAEVNFQLGTGWKNKFANTWKLLTAGEYKLAIANLKKSAWAQQTPNRVNNFIVAINKTFSTSA